MSGKISPRDGLFVFGLCFLFSILSCSEENPVEPNPGVTPELSNLIAPSVVYNASPTEHAISVKVEDPQGTTDISEVSYGITKVSSASLVAEGGLLDDGTQGDIVPKDGVFTTQLQGNFAQNDTGEFELQVTARDMSGNTGNALQTRIFVLAGVENHPPEITTVTAPASVAADSSFDFLVTAMVSDQDGQADIKNVLLQFFPPAKANPTRSDTLTDDGASGDEIPGDGVYTVTLSSTLFSQASDHFIRLQAEDQSGNKSLAKVVAIEGVFLFTGPPVISNLVAPDMVQIDPNQTTRILITLDVTDPQGLSDIAFVRFRSFLPGGQEAQDSPFQLADDGNTNVTGDEVAGDGTYSIVINLPPSGVTPGDFRFVFQAKDKSDLFSNTIEHIMTVVE